MRGLHQRAAGIEVRTVRGVVPIGEAGDEPEEGPPQPLVRRDRRRPSLGPPVHGEEGLPGRLPEPLRAMRVAGVRQQQRQQHRPRRRQRAARPPEMQGRRMAVADRLLPRRFPRHLGDREIHLRQPLARARDHRFRLPETTGGAAPPPTAFAAFQRRRVKRCSSSIRSGSVPLCARIPGRIWLRTPIPRAST